MLASRCLMVNDRDVSVYTGPSDMDEMCIFYIMYYIESKYENMDSATMQDCSSAGKLGRWNSWFQNIPKGTDEYGGITYKESIPNK